MTRCSRLFTRADEVTYCLHIIIRYEIEKAIFRDGVSVDELPALWNRKMEEYLGIVPANDAEGILQDMHWSDGSVCNLYRRFKIIWLGGEWEVLLDPVDF